jgi:hypothetical protein
MGSNEDIMHDFVMKELKRLYPIVDGWQIGHAQKTGLGEGFVISRRAQGRFEGAHVLVSFDKRVTDETIKALQDLAVQSPIPGARSPKLVLMIPQGAEVGNIPLGIEVVPMTRFGYEGKVLVWLKRRAQIKEKSALKAA